MWEQNKVITNKKGFYQIKKNVLDTTMKVIGLN